jgi:hypothetical protein
MTVTTCRPGVLVARLLASSLLWGCNASSFDPVGCEKGTEECGCIADQHCIEGLVCAQKVCLPRESGTDDTTRGESTTGKDDTDTDSSGSTAGSTSGSTSSFDPDEGSSSGSVLDTSESTGDSSGGIYSDCQDDPDICAGGLECLEIDPGGRLEGAMCTSTGCQSSNHCEAPSDGTAQPFCLSIPPPTNETVCVLNCADGAQCPEDMQCYELGLGIEICG